MASPRLGCFCLSTAKTICRKFLCRWEMRGGEYWASQVRSGSCQVLGERRLRSTARRGISCGVSPCLALLLCGPVDACLD